MKFKKLLAVALFFCATAMFAQNGYVPSKALDADNGQSFQEYVNEMNMYYDRLPVAERKGWKQFKRWQHFWEQRIAENGQFPSANMLIDIFKEAKKVKTPDHLLENKWQMLGPIGSPNVSSKRGKGIGRVNCLRLNPNNEKEIWIGAATGGVWKSLDGGQTWKTFDFTNYLSMGVTDIQIAKTNTNTVYVSTGDAHATYPQVNRSCYSVGIIKTTDGGNNWEITSLADSLGERGIMGKIVVDPRNENIVIASTSAGIMKTTDGGNSWNMEQIGSFFDLAYSYENPDILVATTFQKKGGATIYRSTDLGDSWKKIDSYDKVSRIDIETQEAFPDMFWTISVNADHMSLYDIQVSEDYGESFSTLYDVASDGVNLLGRSNGRNDDLFVGQGEYDLAMAIHPEEFGRIYVGGIEVWRTADNANSWDKKTVWYNGSAANYSHADHHDLVFNKDGSILYNCNDGGVFYTKDNGNTWHDLCGNMNIMQFHAFGNDQETGQIIAGAQDNGSSCMNESGVWKYIGGGDGFEGLISKTPTRKYYFYSTYQGLISMSYSLDDDYNPFMSPARVGDAGTDGWQTPYIINPQNPYTMLVGYYQLYIGDIRDRNNFAKKSAFGSNTYISAIAVAESDTNTIYVARGAALYKTTDYGENWEGIFSTSNKITYIAIDPTDPDKAWITVSGFGEDNKVVSIDGDEISDLTGNLPNIPVLCIAHQKDASNRLYIGTDLGVFTTSNNSNYWELMGAEMPRLIINELEIMENTHKLRACTYGRGVWETDLIECIPDQIEIISDQVSELCEGEVVTLTADIDAEKYLWTTGETTKSIKVTESGYYSVVIPKEWGCSDKSAIAKVSFIPVSDLTLTITGDLPFCGENGEVKLRATSSFENYLWNTGETDKRLTITEPGIYYCQAETQTGCIAYSDTIVVERFDLAEVPTITRPNHVTLVSSEAASYQWFRNGNKISEYDQEMTLERDGTYTVEILDSNGCAATSEEFVVNDMSIQELISKGDVLMSENPSNGLFNITFNHSLSSNIRLTVTNTLGETVFAENYDLISSGQQVRIDLTNRAKGMYILNVVIDETPSMLKLIVQ